MNQLEPCTLFPYQEVGAEFLRTNERGFLFDDMGLGKSAQAIRACDLIEAEKVLVLCPASARMNWCREFYKFQRIPRLAKAITSGRDDLPTNGVVVINYDLIHRDAIRNQVLIQQWDAIVLDEVHFLKSHKAARTKAVFGKTCNGQDAVVSQGNFVWAMSGTPAPNNPLELWPMLRAITPGILEYNGKPLDYWQFLNRYCVYKRNNFNGINIIKGRNMSELRNRIKPVMLRRKKQEVLKDLPPILVSQIALDVEDAVSKLQKVEYSEKMEGALKYLSETPVEKVDLDKLQAAIGTEHLATLRQVMGTIKAAAVSKLIQEELEAGLDKIVLMCWHREAIELLYDELNAAGHRTVRLWGGMSAEEQQQSVDSFQNDKRTRVFIGQITAAGQSITLTSAANLMFVEASWSPKVNEQVRDRVYRIGQERQVTIRFASIPGSIDDIVMQVLRRKLSTLNELLE